MSGREEKTTKKKKEMKKILGRDGAVKGNPTEKIVQLPSKIEGKITRRRAILRPGSGSKA